jgi:hypothetical protein
VNIQGKHFFITPDVRQDNASLRVVLAEARKMRQSIQQCIRLLDERIKTLRDEQEAFYRQERDTEEQIDRLSQFFLNKEDTAPTNVRITTEPFDPLDIQALACVHPEAPDAPAVQVRTTIRALLEQRVDQQKALVAPVDSSVPRGPLLATTNEKEDVPPPQLPAKPQRMQANPHTVPGMHSDEHDETALCWIPPACKPAVQRPAPSGLVANNSSDQQVVVRVAEEAVPEEEKEEKAIRNIELGELFTPKQAAAWLGISVDEVMTHYRKNAVRAVAVGCAMRFYGYALRELWEKLKGKKLPLGTPRQLPSTPGPWSVKEVAVLYKVHEATIRLLCEDGVLKPIPGESKMKRRIKEEELERVFPERYISDEANISTIPDRFQDIDVHLAKRCYVDGKQYPRHIWLEAIYEARVHYWRWGLTHYRTKEDDIEKIKAALLRVVAAC